MYKKYKYWKVLQANYDGYWEDVALYETNIYYTFKTTRLASSFRFSVKEYKHDNPTVNFRTIKRKEMYYEKV